MVLKNPSFISDPFKFGYFTNSASRRSFCHPKPKIPASQKSSISGSLTKRNNVSYLIPLVIKSNDPKSTCTPSQASLLRLFL